MALLEKLLICGARGIRCFPGAYAIYGVSFVTLAILGPLATFWAMFYAAGMQPVLNLMQYSFVIQAVIMTSVGAWAGVNAFRSESRGLVLVVGVVTSLATIVVALNSPVALLALLVVDFQGAIVKGVLTTVVLLFFGVCIGYALGKFAKNRFAAVLIAAILVQVMPVGLALFAIAKTGLPFEYGGLREAPLAAISPLSAYLASTGFWWNATLSSSRWGLGLCAYGIAAALLLTVILGSQKKLGKKKGTGTQFAPEVRATKSNA